MTKLTANYILMFLNYIKVAWRYLFKNKTFSLINIGGLALGMAVSMQILIFVLHEFSYDQFHDQAEQIYRLKGKFQFGEQTFQTLAMSAGFGPTTKENVPEVKQYVRISTNETATIKSDYEHIFAEDHFLLADPSILEVFSFPLLKGNPATALNQPQTLVITPEAAKKYFGEEEPVGKTLIYEGEVPFEITGIIQPPPSNSTIQYDFIASLSSLNAIERAANPDITEDQLSLGNNRMQLGSFATYLLLRPEAEVKEISKKIKTLAESPTGGESEFTLDALTDIHFKSNFGDTANIKNIYLFMGIAFLVLALALINYISLTTARSIQRAKEVGVRKVIGAGRRQLIAQFYTESILITLLAFGLGMGITRLSQPFFHQLLQLEIDKAFFFHPLILSVFAGLLVACVVIAGSLPALGLASFRPIQVLRGQLTSGKGGNRMRQGLIIFQFATTIVLIISAVVVTQQIKYAIHQSSQMAQDQIVSVPFSKAVKGSYQAYRSAIQEKTAVKNIAAASNQVFREGISIVFIESPINQKEVPLSLMSVEEPFFDFFQLEWAQPPVDNNRLNAPNTMILNEKAVEKLGLSMDNSLQTLSFFNEELEIIGVLKNFHYQSLHSEIKPLAVRVVSEDGEKMANRGGVFYLKFEAGQPMSDQLAALKNIQQTYDQDQAFSYTFLDEVFADFYKSESRLNKMLTAFTLLAILISCLGIFGLIIYNTERRTKEIGIRKVLGASTQTIVGLLSKEFIVLVIAGFVIAVPVAWYFIHNWLENFAFRIDMPWWVFLLAGLLALLIALVTVGLQSFRAAVANPVNALRNE